MKNNRKAILCSIVAALEIFSAGSFGTIISYASDSQTSDIVITETEAETDDAQTTTTTAPPSEAETTTTTVTTANEDSSDETAQSTTTTTTVSEEAVKTTTTTTAVIIDITETTTTVTLPEDFTAGWYTSDSGKIYYYTENGTALTRIREIEGQKYLFADNGVLKTGWRTIDDQRFYFDPVTGSPVYGWIEYGGNMFYVSSSTGKTTGYFADSDGSCYIFDEYGVMQKGNKFINLDGAVYYAGEDGKLVTETTVIDDVPYIFASNGRLKTGWRTYDGKRYYYDPATGERLTGLIEYEGKYYYVTEEDGKCSGIINIGGMDYLFNYDYGYMETGWLIINDVKRYYYEDGTVAVGLHTIGGNKYYFAENGEMLTGWQTVNGKKYYFGDDGKMVISKWQTINENKYYFNADGLYLTGLQTISGKIYIFSSEGQMLTGWQTSGGFKYYLNENGQAATGWQTISGSKYYFDANGKMLIGWQTISGNKYYFSSEGKMLTGWQTISSNSYYFYTDTGIMAVNTVIDGFQIGSDGIASKLSAVQKRADEIIASIGKNAQDIYNYVRSNNKYKFIETTKTLAEIESIGWSYFADYAMDNRFVVCYYFAAITDVIFRQAGYESRIVYGTGRGSGDHYWNQIKVDGVWTNYDTCNGYANVTDQYLMDLNYTWTQYIVPVYK